MAERTAHPIEAGYAHVKLHETTVGEVRAARLAGGPDFALMVDTNCPWSPREAAEMAARFYEFDLFWLEEPIFPPEDFAALADLGLKSGIRIAAGENACTAWEFTKMFAAGAVAYAQPSVTKVGGISELREVATLAQAAGVCLAPHSPYFGPGFLATLHLPGIDAGRLSGGAHVSPPGGLYPRGLEPPRRQRLPGARRAGPRRRAGPGRAPRLYGARRLEPLGRGVIPRRLP